MKTNPSTIEILESRIALSTFIVLNTSDSGTGSLRKAVLDANAHAGADTIVFKLPAAVAPAVNTILLTGGEMAITDKLTITGPGMNKLIIDGNNASRIFDINDGNNTTDSPVSISGLAF